MEKYNNQLVQGLLNMAARFRNNQHISEIYSCVTLITECDSSWKLK